MFSSCIFWRPVAYLDLEGAFALFWFDVVIEAQKDQVTSQDTQLDKNNRISKYWCVGVLGFVLVWVVHYKHRVEPGTWVTCDWKYCPTVCMCVCVCVCVFCLQNDVLQNDDLSFWLGSEISQCFLGIPKILKYSCKRDSGGQRDSFTKALALLYINGEQTQYLDRQSNLGCTFQTGPVKKCYK
jgi:hypothetical protein